MTVHPGAKIARVLTAKGAIQEVGWHRAVLAVDRDTFVPETVWAQDRDGWYSPLPSVDPEVRRWLGEDVSVVTQVDDGHPMGEDGRGFSPSSSLSQPSLVVRMLEVLGARDGDHVLEIGTGTGYSTSLLCERLGDEAVTSVEVDPGVAERARARLHTLGYKPRLIVGDGGMTTGGQFDRLISTVAVGAVPSAWVTSLAPGGRIVTPWAPAAGFESSWLLCLERVDERTAVGRIMGDAAFMLVREHRPPVDAWRDWVGEDGPGAVKEHIDVNPRCVSDRVSGWRIVLGHMVPGLGYASFEAAEDNVGCAGEATIYVFDREQSWAVAEYEPHGGPYETQRGGPRDLWAEVGSARHAWETAGRPGRDRLGLTVTAEGQHQLWVDEPGNPLQDG